MLPSVVNFLNFDNKGLIIPYTIEGSFVRKVENSYLKCLFRSGLHSLCELLTNTDLQSGGCRTAVPCKLAILSLPHISYMHQFTLFPVNSFKSSYVNYIRSLRNRTETKQDNNFIYYVVYNKIHCHYKVVISIRVASMEPIWGVG